MVSDSRVADVLGRLVDDPRVGWSLGRSGAIAEFYWDPAENPRRRDSPLMIQTTRGALSIRLEPGSRLFASEAIGHAPDSWSQALALCVPTSEAALSGHDAVTPLGPDHEALDASHRVQLLFDLGIGGRYFRLCVRIESGELLEALRSATGKPLLECGELMRALVAASPARVFASKLARIEVNQPIAQPQGQSPEGPHTHLLPELLGKDEPDTSAAPQGWIAQAVAYPAHPMGDALGRRKPFCIGEFQAFQQWLAKFGDPGHLLLKQTVTEAVRQDQSPYAFSIDETHRDSVRIALRQLRCLDGESEALKRWCVQFEA